MFYFVCLFLFLIIIIIIHLLINVHVFFGPKELRNATYISIMQPKLF